MTITKVTALMSLGILVSITWLVPRNAIAESISIDSSITYNTMDGWETSAIWENIGSDLFFTSVLHPYKDQIADIAVNQLGLNRVRLEVTSGAENPVDYFAQFYGRQITRTQLKNFLYQKINDNNDPDVANGGGFHFTYVDYQIENVILPMKQKLEANGESIYISLCLVDFNNAGTTSSLSFANSPAEYAELIHETFKHVENKYGLTIDALEVILEPNNTIDWKGSDVGTKVGNNLVAAVNRLNSNGYSLNEVIAPSDSTMDSAITTFDQMIQVPGVLGLITTFNYHKYGGDNNSNRLAIQTRAQTHGLKTAMLEHFSDAHQNLIADLRQPRISSYQRWAYSAVHHSTYISTDITNPNNVIFGLHDGVHAMAQVFKYVRRNALQIEVSSGNGVAYINQNGAYAVVFGNASFGPHNVSGLPAGEYGITSTGNDSGGSLLTEVSSADITIAAGDTMTFNVPTTGGLITVYSKTLLPPDNTPPNAPTNLMVF